jgi:hypothetical protein
MSDQHFPVFFSESELLLAIEILQRAERGDLRKHETEKAQAIGEVADKLIAAGERAV